MKAWKRTLDAGLRGSELEQLSHLRRVRRHLIRLLSRVLVLTLN